MRAGAPEVIPPKVLLFDLGGVLVDFAGLRQLPAMLARPMPAALVRQKWVVSPAVRQFESGRCTDLEFARMFIEEWSLDLTAERFVAHFRNWVAAPFPETAALLGALEGRHALACLSNTNALHWQAVKQMPALRPVLERPFLSFELGVMKPDPAIYAHVVRGLGCEPAEVAFFDDGPENVEGARAAGLSAHLAQGPVHLRQVLTQLGLL
jgi:putative hydrolase of the HAD superfamily